MREIIVHLAVCYLKSPSTSLLQVKSTNFFLSEAPCNLTEIQKVIPPLPRQHSLNLLIFCCRQKPTAPISSIPAAYHIHCKQSLPHSLQNFSYISSVNVKALVTSKTLLPRQPRESSSSTQSTVILPNTTLPTTSQKCPHFHTKLAPSVAILFSHSKSSELEEQTVGMKTTEVFKH